jgi:hypothetical protein
MSGRSLFELLQYAGCAGWVRPGQGDWHARLEEYEWCRDGRWVNGTHCETGLACDWLQLPCMRFRLRFWWGRETGMQGWKSTSGAGTAGGWVGGLQT